MSAIRGGSEEDSSVACEIITQDPSFISIFSAPNSVPSNTTPEECHESPPISIFLETSPPFSILPQ